MGKIGPLKSHEIADAILQFGFRLSVWWPKYRPSPVKGQVYIRSMPELQSVFPAPPPSAKPVPGEHFLTPTIADRIIMELMCACDPQAFLPSATSAAITSSIPAYGCQYDCLAVAYGRLSRTADILSALQESNRGPLTSEQKADAVASIGVLKDLIVSYLTLLLQEPTVFPLPTGLSQVEAAVSVPERLVLYAYPSVFLSTTTSSGSGSGSDDDNDSIFGVPGKEIMHSVLSNAASSSSDVLKGAVAGSVRAIMRAARGVPSVERICAVDRAFVELVGHAGVPDAVAGLPEWLGANPGSGAQLEETSVLGTLFGMSCAGRMGPLGRDRLQEFRDITAARRGDVALEKRSLYGRMEAHQALLLAAVKAFFKASPRTEEAVLAWMAAALNANAERAKARHDERLLSTHGMLLNLLGVLLMIAQSLATQVPHIQRSYLAASRRLDLRQETRIATSHEEFLATVSNTADAARLRSAGAADLSIRNDIATTASETPNRQTECFFLTMRCFHLAFTCALRTVESIHDAIRRNPSAAASAVPLLRTSATIETYLESEHLLGLAGIFWSIFTRWALSIVCPPPPSQQSTGVEYVAQVPLPNEVPLSFALLPESTIRDVAVYVRHAARINRLLIPVSKINDIMNFFVCFIASRAYVKEFAVRKDLLDALISLIPTRRDAASRVLDDDVFCSHPLSKRFLVPALIRFSVDAEFTGSSSQFYDKLNYRLEAQALYTHLLAIPDYSRAFAAYVAAHINGGNNKDDEDAEAITKFAMYTLNDINFLFEETLENAQHAQALRAEAAKSSAAAADPTTAENISDTRRRAQTTMFMLSKNIAFLLLLIRTSPAPFTASDAVFRLVSDMSVFSLQKLALHAASLSPTGTDSYDFDPAALCASIAEVAAKFADDARFASFCAQNAGFTEELVDATAALISPRGYCETKAAAALKSLWARVVELRASQNTDDDIDIDEDDVPDDYLDTISGEILANPVKLPSGNIIDVTTADKILINDSLDPFSRLPFTKEDLVPLPDLKAQIEAFKKDYRASHAKKKEDGDVEMS